jgi:hypothetical protein
MRRHSSPVLGIGGPARTLASGGFAIRCNIENTRLFLLLFRPALLTDLPERVTNFLPKHAQEIYKEAYPDERFELA